ncbi:MAG: cupin domain-containing protein [Chloroflexi bacterium]|nr:cupin domain-containing protein [Chloroflexota bacterium]
MHPDQDEWFFVLEGAFEFEVGGERVRSSPRATRSSGLAAFRTSGRTWMTVPAVS